MIVTLYMDEHVKGAVTRGLRARGVDVMTVQEDGLSGRPDLAVLDRAMALNRVLFTQDADFLVEATRRQQMGEPFAGVVFAAQESVGIGKCISDLEIVAKAGDSSYFFNRIEFLPY